MENKKNKTKDVWVKELKKWNEMQRFAKDAREIGQTCVKSFTVINVKH